MTKFWGINILYPTFKFITFSYSSKSKRWRTDRSICWPVSRDQSS